MNVNGSFDIIYFYAFDPVTQPELWTVSMFKKIFDILKPMVVHYSLIAVKVS